MRSSWSFSGIPMVITGIMGRIAAASTRQERLLGDGDGAQARHRLVEGERVGHRAQLRRAQERIVFNRLASEPAPLDEPAVPRDDRPVREKALALFHHPEGGAST
jgi:hypothetical protein